MNGVINIPLTEGMLLFISKPISFLTLFHFPIYLGLSPQECSRFHPYQLKVGNL